MSVLYHLEANIATWEGADQGLGKARFPSLHGHKRKSGCKILWKIIRFTALNVDKKVVPVRDIEHPRWASRLITFRPWYL
jgi:hypothetical protein